MGCTVNERGAVARPEAPAMHARACTQACMCVRARKDVLSRLLTRTACNATKRGSSVPLAEPMPAADSILFITPPLLAGARAGSTWPFRRPAALTSTSSAGSALTSADSRRSAGRACFGLARSDMASSHSSLSASTHGEDSTSVGRSLQRSRMLSKSFAAAARAACRHSCELHFIVFSFASADRIRSVCGRHRGVSGERVGLRCHDRRRRKRDGGEECEGEGAGKGEVGRERVTEAGRADGEQAGENLGRLQQLGRRAQAQLQRAEHLHKSQRGRLVAGWRQFDGGLDLPDNDEEAERGQVR